MEKESVEYGGEKGCCCLSPGVNKDDLVPLQFVNVCFELVELCLHCVSLCLLWNCVGKHTQPLVIPVQRLPVGLKAIEDGSTLVCGYLLEAAVRCGGLRCLRLRLPGCLKVLLTLCE